MRKFLISVVLFFSVSVCAALEREVSTTYFEGKTITGLQIDGLCDVIVRQGEPARVTVEMTESPDIESGCKLTNGVLRLKYWDRTRDRLRREVRDDYREKRMKATVTVSRLDDITVMGISNVTGMGRFTSSDCRIRVGNVSTINGLDISTGKFFLTATNVGKVTGLKLNAEQSADFSLANVALVDRLSLRASDVSMTVYNCGKIYNADLKVSSEMRLTQLNASEVNMSCESPKVSLKLLDVAKLNGNGNVNDLDIRMASSSDADIENLIVKNIICQLMNSSKLRCNVSTTASFSADRDCKILYKGSPKVTMPDAPSIRKID